MHKSEEEAIADLERYRRRAERLQRSARAIDNLIEYVDEKGSSKKGTFHRWLHQVVPDNWYDHLPLLAALVDGSRPFLLGVLLRMVGHRVGAELTSVLDEEQEALQAYSERQSKQSFDVHVL